ncbi:MAG: Trm112 family protein [Terracidiphilus sp.]|jgi:uncharacterized protein YbaR (Trm112 family)
MPEKPSRHVPLEADLLELLACPACQGVLAVDEQRLVCAACGRGYPIVDGIPVLIADRVQAPSHLAGNAVSSTSEPTQRTE